MQVAAAPENPRPILPASTAVLLRDAGADLEVLLVRRHGQSGFMPGATVFPGGKIDREDQDATALGRLPGLPGLSREEARAVLVAAVRELHEEAHVLLAVDARGEGVTLEEVRAFSAEIDTKRQGHRLASADWHAAFRRRSWRIDLRGLAVFAHWLTPPSEPRRFDTWFVAAQLPQGQAAALDPHETTDLQWLRPADALQAHLAGGAVLLPPPTWHTLQRLQLWSQAEVACSALRDQGPGPRIMPEFLTQGPDAPVNVLPWDPLSPGHLAWIEAHGAVLAGQHGVAPERLPCVDRFLLRDGRFSRKTDGELA